jgi:hypothetical protein
MPQHFTLESSEHAFLHRFHNNAHSLRATHPKGGYVTLHKSGFATFAGEFGQLVDERFCSDGQTFAQLLDSVSDIVHKNKLIKVSVDFEVSQN